MDTEIATAPTTEIVPINHPAVAANVNEKALAEMSGNGFGAFLPRFQLCGSMSNPVKEELIGVGNFGIVRGKKVEDCGKVVNCTIYGLRLKAMRYSAESVMSYYNPENPEYKAIAAVSLEKDSHCLCGPEYLMHIPGKGWCTLYLTSRSARNESPAVRALLGRNATLTVELVSNKKNEKWHVFRATSCSIPIDRPTDEDVQAEVIKFLNAQDSKVKVAPDSAGGRET